LDIFPKSNNFSNQITNLLRYRADGEGEGVGEKHKMERERVDGKGRENESYGWDEYLWVKSEKADKERKGAQSQRS
jgi:hypothetical protein